MGRWGEVLEDAELVADPVGGEVGGGGQGSFLEFENQGPDGFRVEFHYDGGLGYFLSTSQQEDSADIIQNSAVGNFYTQKQKEQRQQQLDVSFF